MKRILIITYYLPPCGGSGVHRWLKFVKYLPQFNIQPIVITVSPEKASYPILDETLIKDIPENIKVYTTNTFELYNLYKKFLGGKEIPHSGFANESTPGILQNIARFIRGKFFIPDTRKGRNKYDNNKKITSPNNS